MRHYSFTDVYEIDAWKKDANLLIAAARAKVEGSAISHGAKQMIGVETREIVFMKVKEVDNTFVSARVENATHVRFRLEQGYE